MIASTILFLYKEVKPIVIKGIADFSKVFAISFKKNQFLLKIKVFSFNNWSKSK